MLFTKFHFFNLSYSKLPPFKSSPTYEELAPPSSYVVRPQQTTVQPRFRHAGRASVSKVRTSMTVRERFFHDGLTAAGQIGSPSGFSVTVEGKVNKKPIK